MIADKARLLQAGDVVFWQGRVRGVVTETDRHGVGGFYVEWEDGQSGWIAFADAEQVGRTGTGTAGVGKGGATC